MPLPMYDNMSNASAPPSTARGASILGSRLLKATATDATTQDRQQGCERADGVDLVEDPAVQGLVAQERLLRGAAVHGLNLRVELPGDHIADDGPSHCGSERRCAEDHEIRHCRSEPRRSSPTSSHIGDDSNSHSSQKRGQCGLVAGQVAEAQRHRAVGQ